ncbi:hypothetical protein ACFL5Q_00870 [Planctomycetota bacterium]
MTSLAEELFDAAVEWLKKHYRDYTFYLERDLVWTLQCRLRDDIGNHRAPLQVFNDYPILAGKRRSLSADLALVSTGEQTRGQVELAAEFKYEPAHNRLDVLPSKLPVVFWGNDGVGKDVERIQTIVREKRALVAHALFVDEGGAFRHRQPHPQSHWESWGGGIWVLRSRAE